MYRIMLVKSRKDGDQSLYQFLTSSMYGVTKAIDIETKEALDERVEYMLNNGYAKSDFIIVRVIDFELNAGPYSDDSQEEESTETDPTAEDQP